MDARTIKLRLPSQELNPVALAEFLHQLTPILQLGPDNYNLGQFREKESIRYYIDPSVKLATDHIDLVLADIAHDRAQILCELSDDLTSLLKLRIRSKTAGHSPKTATHSHLMWPLD